MKPLSREFLEKRGYCCGNGCSNCPYYPRHTKNVKTKNMLDKLFKFPIIMIDGNKEDEQPRFTDPDLQKLTGENDLELVFGEAECPYDDFLCIADRWLPNDNSYNMALNDRKFDACQVSFDKSGTYIVPWSKERFKKELKKFVDGVR